MPNPTSSRRPVYVIANIRTKLFMPHLSRGNTQIALAEWVPYEGNIRFFPSSYAASRSLLHLAPMSDYRILELWCEFRGVI